MDFLSRINLAKGADDEQTRVLIAVVVSAVTAAIATQAAEVHVMNKHLNFAIGAGIRHQTVRVLNELGLRAPERLRRAAAGSAAIRHWKSWPWGSSSGRACGYIRR
jgi:hypothetical protein